MAMMLDLNTGLKYKYKIGDRVRFQEGYESRDEDNKKLNLCFIIESAYDETELSRTMPAYRAHNVEHINSKYVLYEDEIELDDGKGEQKMNVRIPKFEVGDKLKREDEAQVYVVDDVFVREDGVIYDCFYYDEGHKYYISFTEEEVESAGTDGKTQIDIPMNFTVPEWYSAAMTSAHVDSLFKILSHKEFDYEQANNIALGYIMCWRNIICGEATEIKDE